MPAAKPAVLTCALLAGCALSADPAATAERPMALMDAYLIAHGMAASYAGMPDADPAVVEQLARLDMRAEAAVQSMARRRHADLAATAQAVAALTDYAARQSAAAAP
jgi:hypothetical protein